MHRLCATNMNPSSRRVPSSTTTYGRAIVCFAKSSLRPGGYDPSHYVSERLHAATADGARAAPISLVHRKDTSSDGTVYAVAALRLRQLWILDRREFQFELREACSIAV